MDKRNARQYQPERLKRQILRANKKQSKQKVTIQSKKKAMATDNKLIIKQSRK